MDTVTADLTGEGAGSLKQPLIATDLANYVALQAIATDIESSVSPPDSSVSFDFADLTDNALSIVAVIAPEVEDPMNLLAATRRGSGSATSAAPASAPITTTAARCPTTRARRRLGRRPRDD